MRVNVYAEEITDVIEVIEKTTPDGTFTGLRMYLYLPVTQKNGSHIAGPFMHHPGDNDSAAITVWGKRDLRIALVKMIEELDKHHAAQTLDHATTVSAHSAQSEDHP